jgi:anti-sigma B factor antagonist
VQPSFETSTNGSWTVVTAKGELDLASAPGLREALDAAFVPQEPRIAVDLTDVSFMDSSTLGLLVAYLKRARERGGELRLVGVQGSPAKVIKLTGLDAAFTIDATLSDLSA